MDKSPLFDGATKQERYLPKRKEDKIMKQTYTVPVKLPEDLMRKLLIVCKSEGRTPNNQFLFMLRNNIQYYERTKGKITPAAMKEQDVAPFADAIEEE